MKFLTIALAILAGTLASCSKQDDDINNVSPGTEVGQRAEAGKIHGFYTIGKFYMNSLDHTNEFKGVRLFFGNNNLLNVYDNGRNYKGVWGVSYEEDLLKIYVTSGDRLERLNGGYRIVSVTSNRVTLKSLEDDTRTLVLDKGLFRPRVSQKNK